MNIDIDEQIRLQQKYEGYLDDPNIIEQNKREFREKYTILNNIDYCELYLTNPQDYDLYYRDLSYMIGLSCYVSKKLIPRILDDSYQRKKGIGKTPSLSDDTPVYIINISGLNIIVKWTSFYKIADMWENDETVNESFIAIEGTNHLREFIPNYSYVYAGIRSNDIHSYIRAKTTPYPAVSMYEYIDGVTFKEFIKYCTVKEMIEVFIQVFESLYMGNMLIDFTHYDLHSANVVIKKLDTPITINYMARNDNLPMSIETNILAVIIDYGSSHIKSPDPNIDDRNNAPLKNYGRNFLEVGISAKKSFWLHDVFKFVMFARLYYSKEARRESLLAKYKKEIGKFLSYLRKHNIKYNKIDGTHKPTTKNVKLLQEHQEVINLLENIRLKYHTDLNIINITDKKEELLDRLSSYFIDMNIISISRKIPSYNLLPNKYLLSLKFSDYLDWFYQTIDEYLL